MTKYPMGRLARASLRREVLERHLAEAEAQALMGTRTSLCFEGRHAGHLTGCRAEPTDCGCECHDPEAGS